MLIFYEMPEVGDVYEIVLPGIGIEIGTELTYTGKNPSRPLGFGNWSSDVSSLYGLTETWIKEGYAVKKEKTMSIVFEETQMESSTAAPPAWGEEQKRTLMSVIAEANASTNKTTLIDCINARYRTKQYRDLILENKAKGTISDQQILDMKFALAGIRHNQRTPRAKAYRYEWP